MVEDVRTEEEENTQTRSRILGLGYINTSTMAEKPLFREYLSIEDMYEMRVVPIKGDENNIIFGVTNNTSQFTMKSLRDKFIEQHVGYVLISDSGFRDFMLLYDPPSKIVYNDISITDPDVKKAVAAVSLTLDQVKADDMLAYLVQQAHRLNSSDIHVETQNEAARVRLRIDGILHPVAELDLDKYRILIAAIASAGNVSTSSQEPQQGHIFEHVKMADGKQVDVNVRLETTPTINGMDVVMRLFNMDQSMFTLDKLGLSDEERKVVDEIIAKPNGLVMVVGPTGSGKTTTLYSILNTLNNNERKIITIEDPVEYQFQGITQIPVTSTSGQEVNFANRLRAVLRLDPDIVMVGEIRDPDTAKTALQAALTGHLVLATFHAGTAAAAITRILDIIGENPLLISSIRLVMAQRLVRRLDDATKQAYAPDEKILTMIKSVIDTLPSNIPKPDLTNLQLYRAGSSPENPFGYTGQLAIREQFLMTGEVLKLLSSNKVSSTDEIEKAAIDSGMRTMQQDGMLKVVAGLTAIEEIFRVIG